MRIWDLDPQMLCRNHLLGEHRELHAIWKIVTQGKRGYRFHPEVKRWEGKLKALFRRHQRLVGEMDLRGYHHQSPLEERLAIGQDFQDIFIDSLTAQKEKLRKKGCLCKV